MALSSRNLVTTGTVSSSQVQYVNVLLGIPANTIVDTSSKSLLSAVLV